MNCKHCAEALPSHAKFCLNCGLKVAPPSVEVKAPSSVPPQTASDATVQHPISSSSENQSRDKTHLPDAKSSDSKDSLASVSRALKNGGTESWSAEGTEYRLDTPNRKEYEYRSHDGKQYVHEVSIRSDNNNEEYLFESRNIASSDDKIAHPRLTFERQMDDRLMRIRRDFDKTMNRLFPKNYTDAFRRSFGNVSSTPLIGSTVTPKNVDGGDIWDSLWSDFDRSFNLFHEDWKSRMEAQLRTHLEDMERAIENESKISSDRLSAPQQ